MIQWENTHENSIQWLGDEPQTLGSPGLVESTAGLIISVGIIAGAVWLGLYLYNK